VKVNGVNFDFMLTIIHVLIQTWCGAAVGRVGDVINGNETQ